jgi:hypothetical protein
MMLATALIVIGSASAGALIMALILVRPDNSAEGFFKNRDPEVPKEISRRSL